MVPLNIHRVRHRYGIMGNVVALLVLPQHQKKTKKQKKDTINLGFSKMERTCLDKSALKAMDDYWEYRRIVGDDDEGKLFTPEQYEEYKRKVLPQRAQNRLYVSFGVPGGIDCKLIGPETQCFCTHRYRQHKTDFEVVPSERPITLPCQVRGCHCTAYQYVARIGPHPVRCRCKHLPQDHSEATGNLCKKWLSRIVDSTFNSSTRGKHIQFMFTVVSSQQIFQVVPVLGSRAPTPVGVASPALPIRP
ncbi:hypothetical protein L3Q82_014903, partial [Scortum barcoo]